MANPAAVKAAASAALDPKKFVKKKILWFVLPYLLPVFLIAGILIAAVGIVAPAASASCDATGAAISGGTAVTQAKVANFDQAQMNNAATIIATGRSVMKSKGVTGATQDRGVLISLMVSLQESTLRNLAGGDRDSVGLFQQRNGWSTNPTGNNDDPRRDPVKTTTQFFIGGKMGANKDGLLTKGAWAGSGLLRDVWPSLSLNDAAQGTQASGTPNAYAKWEATARQLVSKIEGAAGTTGNANDPADPAGAATAGAADPDDTTDPDNAVELPADCVSDASDTDDDGPSLGAPDGTMPAICKNLTAEQCFAPAVTHNKRTVDQAIAWDVSQLHGQSWSGLCDHVVGLAYAWPHSGSTTARVHWGQIPADYKVKTSTGIPPRGALIFFNNSKNGHVVISMGNGYVYTSDSDNRNGYSGIGKRSLKDIEGWKSSGYPGGMLGWAVPVFPGNVSL